LKIYLTLSKINNNGSNHDENRVVIWVDGCFDMMHFGHANALRQAKELGDYLIVGVHSDNEIMRIKGPTVMIEEERYAAVRACKWVDEVVEDAPYTTELSILKKHHVTWCVHGDDICVDENGIDAYANIKAAGIFKVVKRTVGVSTTDIVNRMLLLSPEVKNQLSQMEVNPFAKLRQHYPSAQKIRQFTTVINEPKQDDIIVYIDGVFDLFHIGHVEILKEAKKLGTYLIVGIHDDETARSYKERPAIMNIHERVLGVLSCRYVDDVIIGCPYIVTQEIIETLRINVVCHGTVLESVKVQVDPYELPKQMGIFKEIQSPRSYLTAQKIVDRILENHKIFEERNLKKFKKDNNNSNDNDNFNNEGKQ